jgi:hypothetical protein
MEYPMGLDHRIGHFRPLRIMASTLKSSIQLINGCSYLEAQVDRVVDTMIEALFS